MKKLTAAEARQLNSGAPEQSNQKLGDRIKDGEDHGLYVFRYEITADATSGATQAALPFDVEVTDVTVVATASNSGGTLTLQDGDGNAITDAIACATDTNTDRADTIDDANYRMAEGETPQVVANGANDRGIMYVYARRR